MLVFQFIKRGFRQKDRLDKQHRNVDTFYRGTVVNVRCVIGSEKFRGARLNSNYAADKNSRESGKIASCVSCFTQLVKDIILLPYIGKKT